MMTDLEHQMLDGGVAPHTQGHAIRELHVPGIQGPHVQNLTTQNFLLAHSRKDALAICNLSKLCHSKFKRNILNYLSPDLRGR